MLWPEAKEFMKFTSKQGRESLLRHNRIPNVVDRKWFGVLPAYYKLRWNNVWDLERIRKEAGLMWMIWHKAVAVNAWRSVISQEIDQSCPVCLRGIRETVMHGFWECPAAQKAWKWCEKIINHLAPSGEREVSQAVCLSIHTVRADHHRDRVACARQETRTREPRLRHNSVKGNKQDTRPQELTINWKQGIFGHRLPNRFKPVSKVWLFIRGVVLWHIWEQRNEAAFDGRHWHTAKLYHKLWFSMIDYGRLSWSRVQGKMVNSTNNPEKIGKIVNDFQNSWCRKNLFALWESDQPQWNLVDPRYVNLT